MPDRTHRHRAAWRSSESFATTLLLLYVDAYGGRAADADDDPDALHWDPETILRTVNDELAGPLPAANFDRLMTAIAIVTTDTFYKRLDDFIKFCNILMVSHWWIIGKTATVGKQ